MPSKQGWRFVTESDSLSAKIPMAVYYPSMDVLASVLGNHPSQVCWGIHEGLSVLKQGLIRQIGNGESMHIWNQTGFQGIHLLRALHPLSPNPCELVADLFDGPSRSWNKSVV